MDTNHMTNKARRLVQNEDDLLLQLINSRCKRDAKFANELLLDLADVAKEQGSDPERFAFARARREQWIKKCTEAWDWEPEKSEVPP